MKSNTPTLYLLCARRYHALALDMFKKRQNWYEWIIFVLFCLVHAKSLNSSNRPGDSECRFQGVKTRQGFEEVTPVRAANNIQLGESEKMQAFSMIHPVFGLNSLKLVRAKTNREWKSVRVRNVSCEPQTLHKQNWTLIERSLSNTQYAATQHSCPPIHL